jgi:DNA-binding IclR family transcriptional regulator
MRVTDGSLRDGGGRSASAADRVLSVLEAVIAQAPKATLAAIATQTDLPKPTAHRLLRVLVDRGYVRQADEGLYSPDLQILALADRVQDSLDVAQRARPIMGRLQEILPETVHLAILQGDHAVYVEKLEGRRAYRMASTVGMTLALHSTAIGKASLAYLPEADWRSRLGPGDLPRRTARTTTSVEALALEFARIRECGYAIDDEENEEHIRCVGAAVFDHRGHAVGGVSLSAPAFALTLRHAHELGPALAVAAGEISRNLGARDDQLPDAYRQRTKETLIVLSRA